MKKKIGILLGVVLFVMASFWAGTHLIYHRSVMASLAEMYMVIIDRDIIYEEGNEYYENLELRAVENLKEHTIPKGVKMHIPYESKHEHGMQVIYFNEEAFTDTLIIYIPGGGYLNDPLKYHWKLIDKLSSETNTPVLMTVYPKVPNYTCDESYEIMTEFYLDVASRPGVKRIVFMGDSSGGGMSLALAQQLRDRYPEVLQPDDLVLIAPWMDVSMENEEILEIEPKDTMLGLHGTIDLGKRWAGDRDVHDPLVSPIYGTFENLGHMTVFAGTKDMLYPDIAKFSGILTEQGIEHTFVVEENLVHPYPLFPIPEAADAREIMINVINETD